MKKTNYVNNYVNNYEKKKSEIYRVLLILLKLKNYIICNETFQCMFIFL